jgi:RNA polymerase subunit RPABC4/transcription elongation factor Spt4
MAYKCKNCGKFVAKDAAICNHCGQENPAESVQNSIERNTERLKIQPVPRRESEIIQCPNCGNQIILPKELQNEYYLRCNICNQDFANPLKSLGRGENYLKKYGCLLFIIFIAFVSVIAYFTDGGERIKADGKTEYTITKDIYAPSTEEAAKSMINSMARNGNNAVSNFEYVYNNDANFTHVFANDKVVVLRKISSGYLIRKLRDYQTAVVPNDSYLKE